MLMDTGTWRNADALLRVPLRGSLCAGPFGDVSLDIPSQHLDDRSRLVTDGSNVYKFQVANHESVDHSKRAWDPLRDSLQRVPFSAPYPLPRAPRA